MHRFYFKREPIYKCEGGGSTTEPHEEPSEGMKAEDEFNWTYDERKKVQKQEKGITITLFPARAKYFASIAAEERGKQECTVTIETSPPSESVTHNPNAWFKINK